MDGFPLKCMRSAIIFCFLSIYHIRITPFSTEKHDWPQDFCLLMQEIYAQHGLNLIGFDRFGHMSVHSGRQAFCLSSSNALAVMAMTNVGLTAVRQGPDLAGCHITIHPRYLMSIKIRSYRPVHPPVPCASLRPLRLLRNLRSGQAPPA